MSAQQLITDHLDLWTAAVTSKSTAGRGRNGKIELTGIKKLRELILELAVRGKLVEQDPTDEPASVLLERIAEEKARLVKEGKIRKPKKLPEVSNTERQFEIPSNWKWERLDRLFAVVTDGDHQAPPKSENGTPFLVISNISKGALDFSECRKVPHSYYDQLDWGRKPTKGDILYTVTGSYGIPVKVNADKNFCVQRHIAILKASHSTPTPFLEVILGSPYAKSFASAIATGIAQKTVPLTGLRKLPVALPPEIEQQRIVEKVDELMAVCDRLEQQVGDQLEAHELLVDTLLDALTRSVDAAEVSENWSRIAEYFDTLFTTETSIDKLKQTILQLAVMGRLVEQGPSDEPASVLLESIAEEKARLVKEGKVKKSKSLAEIKDEERSFPIHENWAWARFQDIANEISTGPFGSMLHKHDYVDDGVPLINPSHMVNGNIQEDRSVSIPSPKAEELSSYKLDAGDVVMARRGEVGRCAIVTDREAGWLCGTGSFVLRFHDSLSRRFILMMFTTDRVRSYLTGNSVGTTMTNLNHGILNRMPVALPPSGEQHRIVEKVDELIALCDQLKARLGEAGETRTQLAKAVVEQAVS